MPLGPLAVPGRETELAAEIGRQLTRADPPAGALAFGPMRSSRRGRKALRASWPGRSAPARAATFDAKAQRQSSCARGSYEDGSATVNRNCAATWPAAASIRGGGGRPSAGATPRRCAPTRRRRAAAQRRWGRGVVAAGRSRRAPATVARGPHGPLIEQGRFGWACSRSTASRSASTSASRRVVAWRASTWLGRALRAVRAGEADAAARRRDGLGARLRERRARPGAPRLQGADRQRGGGGSLDDVVPPGARMPIAYAQPRSGPRAAAVREGVARLPEPWAARVKRRRRGALALS